MSFFAFVTAPVSEAEPCGPDLDGDADFENYVTSAEGRLPASYFAFSKTDLDLANELKNITALLKRSRDVRLLVLAAKFSILAGDIAGFAGALAALSALFAEQWDNVHPAAVDGSHRLREAHLSTLNDLPTVMLPLQYAALVNTKQYGAVSYRSQLIAAKAVPKREGETELNVDAVREALLKAEDFGALKASFEALHSAAAALGTIRAQFVDRAGPDSVPDFDKLAGLLSAMTGFLTPVLQERDPSIAPAMPADGHSGQPSTDGAPDAPAVSGPAMAIASSGDAAAALAAVEQYFRRNEPSSPATLLVRQAQLLIGKSFIEAMVILSPALAEKAAIKFGGETPLTLSSALLKTLAAQKPEPSGIEAPASALVTIAATRAEALACMEAVERFFQRTEPSSPVPLLLGRARSYSGKDFAALMKDVLS